MPECLHWDRIFGKSSFRAHSELDSSVGGILGLTASDVQLGAALPDRIPPFYFLLTIYNPLVGHAFHELFDDLQFFHKFCDI